jgi:hypothetical protein
MNLECLAALAARWREDATSAEWQGEESDEAGAIGTGAYWLGRADALRDAARELAELTLAHSMTPEAVRRSPEHVGASSGRLARRGPS